MEIAFRASSTDLCAAAIGPVTPARDGAPYGFKLHPDKNHTEHGTICMLRTSGAPHEGRGARQKRLRVCLRDTALII
jgi:hypothetical protein